MRILFLTERVPFPPHNDGGTIINYHLLNYLSKNHEIDLVTFYTSEIIEYKRDIETICSSFTFVERNMEVSKFKKILLCLLKKIPSDVIFYSTSMNQMIEHLINNNKYDLIYTDLLSMSIYTMDINIGIPKVISPHDCSTLLYETYDQNEKNVFKKIKWKIKKNLFKHYEKKVYQKFDKCFFVSDKDEKYASELIPNIKACSIPNGVDLNHFYLNDAIINEPNTLVFTGNMDYKPNVDAMLYFCNQILPIVMKEFPKIKLYIVGKKPVKEIRELASNNVIVTGFVDEIRDHVWKSSIFICPLMSGAGIKNKVLEAMAMGKAIVATTISCDGINVKDGTNIIIRNNKSEFSSAIIELLMNNDLRDVLGKNARNTIEKFYSWNQICSNYEIAIKNVKEKV